MPPDAKSIVITPPTVSTWFGFAALCIGMFMAILDVQIVSTSLPNIQHALDIDPDQMSWIQTAYLIAEVVAIPLNGFLTRLLTMRWLFVCGIILFTLASVGCALSGNFSELLAWRIVQGLAGGALIPLIFSAVFILFPENLQGIATTAAGVVAVLAPTVGPMVGGWITELYSWHWLFLINVLPGITAAVLAATLLPREQTRLGEIRKLDLISLFMMAIALAAMEIALQGSAQARLDGRSSPRPCRSRRCQLCRICPSHLEQPGPFGEPAQLQRPQLYDRVRLELSAWVWPVRLGLPDARIPGLRPWSQRIHDWDDDAGNGRAQIIVAPIAVFLNSAWMQGFSRRWVTRYLPWVSDAARS